MNVQIQEIKETFLFNSHTKPIKLPIFLASYYFAYLIFNEWKCPREEKQNSLRGIPRKKKYVHHSTNKNNMTMLFFSLEVNGISTFA